MLRRMGLFVLGVVFLLLMAAVEFEPRTWTGLLVTTVVGLPLLFLLEFLVCDGAARGPPVGSKKLSSPHGVARFLCIFAVAGALILVFSIGQGCSVRDLLFAPARLLASHRGR